MLSGKSQKKPKHIRKRKHRKTMKAKSQKKIQETSGAKSFFIPAKDKGCVDCVARVPENLNSDAEVLVAVHGISRSPFQQIAMFSDMAEKRGAVLVAPLFDKKKWQGYQRLFCRRKSRRADLALIKTLNSVYELLGIKERKILLYGYSGGGQFAHRFAFVHPERVQAVALGASGWYTMPDVSISFPFGLGISVRKNDQISIDAHCLAGVRYFVAVGDRDILLDRALNKKKEISARQGKNRVERAQSWVEAMKEHIESCRAGGSVQLSILEGVAHSFRQCMSDELYVNSLEQFFFSKC